MTRRGFLGWLGAGAVGYSGGRLLDCSDDLSVETKDLIVPRWTLGKTRIALLSDFHVHNPNSSERVRRACELAAARKPDLVLLTGDYTHFTSHDVIPQLRHALEGLEAFDAPIFAVLGNHDYWTRDPDKVIQTVGSSRARLLQNEATWIEGVSIFGVDDAINERSRFEFCASIPENSLVLLHEPDYVRDVPQGASLMVAGHSHGGQFCLPGGIAMYTPRGARRYISGFYPNASTPLYVTRGIGNIGKGRYFCRPEVSILDVGG